MQVRQFQNTDEIPIYLSTNEVKMNDGRYDRGMCLLGYEVIGSESNSCVKERAINWMVGEPNIGEMIGRQS